MRHELFDQWLKNNAKIDEIMTHLGIANFDPEFYRHYEKEIVDQFNKQTGKTITLSKKKWWQTLLNKA